jgi:hypothetical protein
MNNMARPVEFHPSEHIVYDDNGDVRVAEDFMQPGSESLVEIPDAPVLPMIYKPTEPETKTQTTEEESDDEDPYYAELDRVSDRFPSDELARADLARRGFVEPVQNPEVPSVESDHSTAGKTGFEAIHAAQLASKLAEAEKIFDPIERERAINQIYALHRAHNEHRNDPSGPVSYRHHS